VISSVTVCQVLSILIASLVSPVRAPAKLLPRSGAERPDVPVTRSGVFVGVRARKHLGRADRMLCYVLFLVLAAVLVVRLANRFQVPE
jgi:hypothetical protein